jgi:hypothetical protein
LEREFEKREVSEVVKAINGDKALGNNNYSIALYQSLLGYVKRRHYEGFS